MIPDEVVAEQDMDFGDPWFFKNQCAKMFLGMDASHATTDQRANQKFQTPAFKHDGLRWINQDELLGWQGFLAGMVWILLQDKVRQMVDRKAPYPVGINELGVIRQHGNQFDTSGELRFVFS